MLIPLGFFGGGAAPSAFELISSISPNGSQNTVSFATIPQTFKHLQLRFSASIGSPSNTEFLQLRINGIGSANYYTHTASNNNGNIQGSGFMSGTDGFIRLWANRGMRGRPTSGIVDFTDYTNAGKNPQILFTGGIPSEFEGVMISGALLSNQSVSSISLTTAANAFSTNTRFSLYGIKG